MFAIFIPKLLNMSLVAGVAVIFILLLRLLLKKAPKVISYTLWGVVLFRLLCPVSFESSLSLFGLLDATVNESIAVTDTTPLPEQNFGEQLEYDTPTNTTPSPPTEIIVPPEYSEEQLPTTPDVEAPKPTTPTTETKEPLSPYVIAGGIWAVGVLAMAAYAVISYIKLKRQLITASPLRDNIYLADGITSPFVMGIIKPRIYLPSDLSEKEQPYIILHEQQHIRRGDHIVKLVAFAALCIHWFNPLVWVAFIMSGKDMEMSCDEAVIKKMGESVRADYAASLLSLATGKRIIAGMPLAFGEGDTKGRIRNLASWRKPAFWVILIAAVACVALAVCLITNPVTSLPFDLKDISIESAKSIDTRLSSVGLFDLDATQLEELKSRLSDLNVKGRKEGFDDLTPVYYINVKAEGYDFDLLGFDLDVNRTALCYDGEYYPIEDARFKAYLSDTCAELENPRPVVGDMDYLLSHYAVMKDGEKTELWCSYSLEQLTDDGDAYILRFSLEQNQPADSDYKIQNIRARLQLPEDVICRMAYCMDGAGASEPIISYTENSDTVIKCSGGQRIETEITLTGEIGDTLNLDVTYDIVGKGLKTFTRALDEKISFELKLNGGNDILEDLPEEPEEDPVVPTDRRPMIYIDNNLYLEYDYKKNLPEDATLIGEVVKTVDQSEQPAENFTSNTTFAAVGSKIYAARDMSEVYVEILGSDSGGYLVYVKAQADSTSKYDISQYSKGSGSIATVCNGNTYYYSDVIYDPNELAHYISLAEYAGSVEVYFDDENAFPYNDLESNHLPEGTKLYLLGEHLVAEFEEPHEWQARLIYGQVLLRDVDVWEIPARPAFTGHDPLNREYVDDAYGIYCCIEIMGEEAVDEWVNGAYLKYSKEEFKLPDLYLAVRDLGITKQQLIEYNKKLLNDNPDSEMVIPEYVINAIFLDNQAETVRLLANPAACYYNGRSYSLNHMLYGSYDLPEDVVGEYFIEIEPLMIEYFGKKDYELEYKEIVDGKKANVAMRNFGAEFLEMYFRAYDLNEPYDFGEFTGIPLFEKYMNSLIEFHRFSKKLFNTPSFLNYNLNIIKRSSEQLDDCHCLTYSITRSYTPEGGTISSSQGEGVYLLIKENNGKYDIVSFQYTVKDAYFTGDAWSDEPGGRGYVNKDPDYWLNADEQEMLDWFERNKQSAIDNLDVVPPEEAQGPSEDEVLSLFERYDRYHAITQIDSPNISTEEHYVYEGEKYYPVIEEDIDTWSEWESFVKSIFYSAVADTYIQPEGYLNVNGRTYHILAGGINNSYSEVKFYDIRNVDDSNAIITAYRETLYEGETGYRTETYKLCKESSGEWRIEKLIDTDESNITKDAASYLEYLEDEGNSEIIATKGDTSILVDYNTKQIYLHDSKANTLTPLLSDEAYGFGYGDYELLAGKYEGLFWVEAPTVNDSFDKIAYWSNKYAIGGVKRLAPGIWIVDIPNKNEYRLELGDLVPTVEKLSWIDGQTLMFLTEDGKAYSINIATNKLEELQAIS